MWKAKQSVKALELLEVMRHKGLAPCLILYDAVVSPCEDVKQSAIPNACGSTSLGKNGVQIALHKLGIRDDQACECTCKRQSSRKCTSSSTCCSTSSACLGVRFIHRRTTRVTSLPCGAKLGTIVCHREGRVAGQHFAKQKSAYWGNMLILVSRPHLRSAADSFRGGVQQCGSL